MNTEDEMMQYTINLACSLELAVDLEKMKQAVRNLNVSESNVVTLDQYIEWFTVRYLPPGLY